jgi:hypothetical protein
MTIYPWYDVPEIGELFRSITSSEIDQVEVGLILQAVAKKVRDMNLIENLNELIYDWRNLRNSTVH